MPASAGVKRGKLEPEQDRIGGRKAAFAPQQDSRVYVCGPTTFVEAVADNLVALGHRPGRIRTERFGATGVLVRATKPEPPLPVAVEEVSVEVSR